MNVGVKFPLSFGSASEYILSILKQNEKKRKKNKIKGILLQRVYSDSEWISYSPSRILFPCNTKIRFAQVVKRELLIFSLFYLTIYNRKKLN